MKYYLYFPGCSAKSTAKGLGLSVLAIAQPLDMGLIELDDWTCCGSTPYGSLNGEEAILVAARNLALAEKTRFTVLNEKGIPVEKTGLDLVTPCSSCYVTLYKANSYLREHPQFKTQVNEALAVANLEYHGNVRVRQLMEVR